MTRIAILTLLCAYISLFSTTKALGQDLQEKIVYSSSESGGRFNIWMVNPDGTGKKQITFDTIDCVHPTISHDGRYVAFNRQDSGFTKGNIYLYSFVTGQTKQLTSKADAAYELGWSPNDSEIVYTTSCNIDQYTGGRIIALVRVADTSVRIIKPDCDNGLYDAHFHPTDGYIYFHAHKFCGWGEFKINPENGLVTEVDTLLPFYNSDWRFNPVDPRIVAMGVRDSCWTGPRYIAIYNTATGVYRTLEELPRKDEVAWSWSPRGANLGIVASDSTGKVSICSADTLTGRRYPILTLDSGITIESVCWGAIYNPLNLRAHLQLPSRKAVVGDVDNDGKNELVVGHSLGYSSDTSVVEIYRYTAGQYVLLWSYRVKGYWVFALVADVDNDGLNELIISIDDGDYGGYVEIFKHEGGLQFDKTWSQFFSTVRFPRGVSVGDANNDGKNELIVGVAWYSRQIRVFTVNSAYDLSELWSTAGSDIRTTEIADVNGDQLNELVAGTASWSWWDWRFYSWNGANFGLTFNSGKLGCVDATIGDVNADSKNEVVITSKHTGGVGVDDVRIYRFAGGNSYTLDQSWNVGKAGSTPVVGKLIPPPSSQVNQIAFLSPCSPGDNVGDSAVHVLEYTSTGLREIWRSDPFSDGGEGDCEIGDVDNDGSNELIVAHPADGIFVYGFSNANQVKGPTLYSPADLATMDNGCSSKHDSVNWSFQWTAVAGASKYHLTVIQPQLGTIVDTLIADTEYVYRGSAIREAYRYQWRWRVSALVNDVWSTWSVQHRFDVRPECYSRSLYNAALFVVNSAHPDFEEVAARDFAQLIGYSVTMIEATQIINDISILDSFSVYLAANASKPSQFDDQIIVSALESEIGQGKCLLTSWYGHYFIDYLHLGTVVDSTTRTGIYRQPVFWVDSVDASPVFDGLLSWKPPALRPDDPDQELGYFRDGRVLVARVSVSVSAPRVDYRYVALHSSPEGTSDCNVEFDPDLCLEYSIQCDTCRGLAYHSLTTIRVGKGKLWMIPWSLGGGDGWIYATKGRRVIRNMLSSTAVDTSTTSVTSVSYMFPVPSSRRTDGHVNLVFPITSGRTHINLRIFDAGLSQVDKLELDVAPGQTSVPVGIAQRTPGVYMYDLRISYSDGSASRMERGKFIVIP